MGHSARGRQAHLRRVGHEAEAARRRRGGRTTHIGRGLVGCRRVAALRRPDMWRALVFIGLLALAAFGAVWLADHPGTLSVTWQGREYATSLAVGLVAIIVMAMILSFIGAAFRSLPRLPHRVGEGSRRRRETRGRTAVSRGMIAI